MCLVQIRFASLWYIGSRCWYCKYNHIRWDQYIHNSVVILYIDVRHLIKLN